MQHLKTMLSKGSGWKLAQNQTNAGESYLHANMYCQKVLCCALFDFLRVPIQLSLTKSLVWFIIFILTPHTVVCSNMTSGILVLSHTKVKQDVVTMQTLSRAAGQWSLNETTSLPVCVCSPLLHHNVLCSSVLFMLLLACLAMLSGQFKTEPGSSFRR